MTNALAIRFIECYQRFLSPYKGWRCAHKACHGGWSCSQYIKRAIEKAGLRRAFLLAIRRARSCRKAAGVLWSSEEGEPTAPDKPRIVSTRRGGDQTDPYDGVDKAGACLSLPCFCCWASNQ